MRRTSSRFCLGVEHGDYNGTELFGVGTDRFIWFAYKPNGTNKVRLFSGNFPKDGRIEFTIGNVPAPKSAAIAETWGRFPYGIDYILKREGFKLKQGIDGVLFGNIPGGGMSRSASLCVNLILSLFDVNGIEVEKKVQIVDLAQAVENDYIGSPCGKLDQTMVLFAKEGHGDLLQSERPLHRVRAHGQGGDGLSHRRSRHGHGPARPGEIDLCSSSKGVRGAGRHPPEGRIQDHVPGRYQRRGHVPQDHGPVRQEPPATTATGSTTSTTPSSVSTR